MRFLGVDLAWKDGNPSGVALLGGQKFPLHLRETVHTLDCHPEVHGWIARQVRNHRAAVGIDAPLLGLATGARRECDDAISRAFGRFHASTHSPSRFPGLEHFAARLVRDHGMRCFAPDWRPAPALPAIREVYPNALQVMLFGLDTKPRSTIVKYKRRRFPTKADWVHRGLGPFVHKLMNVVAGRYVVPAGREWQALVSATPSPSMTGAELKSIEDRWDALLCALAVALEFFQKGSMRPYPDSHNWRQGYILAPVLKEGRER